MVSFPTTKSSLLLSSNELYLQTLCAMIDVSNYGGGRGIRTPARYDPPVGFQDRSLQPDLGIPPYRQD